MRCFHDSLPLHTFPDTITPLVVSWLRITLAENESKSRLQRPMLHNKLLLTCDPFQIGLPFLLLLDFSGKIFREIQRLRLI
jgi:hypothetical protein